MSSFPWLGIASAQPAADQGEVRIQVWPSQVPCSDLKHNPDGSWTTTKTVHVQDQTIDPATFRNAEEDDVWNETCGGK